MFVNKNKVKLPKTIDPCPIVDALLEIRFSSKINANAVFGVIYNVLQTDFPKVESLPILQLPENVRTADPNLKYKPYYKVSNEGFVMQVGPDVFSISSFPNYQGWEEFSKVIFDVLKKVEDTNVIGTVQRLGIRYINFFDSDIFKNIDLKVCIKEDDIHYKNTVVRTEIEQNPFFSTLQIANSVNVNGKPGSIIDIDTYKTTDLEDFFLNKKEIIGSGHLKEKELFFSLLKSEFLMSLNPKY
jgi:uncharacterized protein (TIGR04255 family)